ncbi:MAG: PQQ-binding-like beta-propeller repeat protein [Planctomycetota bacterium]|nr:PQQ-binding-like beta-propeller repeat protein [Planctomycetota bacterium]
MYFRFQLLLSLILVFLLDLGGVLFSHAQETSVSADVELSSQDWPWWRGPERNGHASDQKLPIKFGNSENVLWKSPVPGRGHSSPVLVGGKIFLTSADEGEQVQYAIAYDLATGKQLWKREIAHGGFPEQNHRNNTEASATIASDGKRLFTTLFHHGIIELSALKLDGQLLWQKRASKFNPRRYRYGYAPSPLIYRNLVIVSAEYDGEDSSIAAFDRKTGVEVWRADRKENITFSSPVVGKVAGRDQLFLSGSGQVVAYDPASGRQLWAVAGTTAATCGTAVWDGDLVFASGGYPDRETIAVVADGSGKIAWKNKQKCYEQSMIVVDGYLYGFTDQGVLYCWRCNDGQEMWRERLGGRVSASPIYAGGYVYWANESGTMYVFKPSPDRFNLESRNRLGSEAFASPAVSGDKLLLRVAEGKGGSRQEYLVCIGGTST